MSSPILYIKNPTCGSWILFISSCRPFSEKLKKFPLSISLFTLIVQIKENSGNEKLVLSIMARQKSFITKWLQLQSIFKVLPSIWPTDVSICKKFTTNLNLHYVHNLEGNHSKLLQIRIVAQSWSLSISYKWVLTVEYDSLELFVVYKLEKLGAAWKR